MAVSVITESGASLEAWATDTKDEVAIVIDDRQTLVTLEELAIFKHLIAQAERKAQGNTGSQWAF